MLNHSRPVVRQSVRCTAASASMPLHHMRSCCSGVASITQPSMVYGMLSEGTRPSTWSMEKKGTPKYCGSSSYQPRRGSGTAEPPSPRARMARYCVENSASRKSRCLVGATRTTRRFSSPSAVRVRHRIVSLENPLEPGAFTSKTSGARPSDDFVANQRERMEATWSGSRWLMSGTVRHSTDDAALPCGGGELAPRFGPDGRTTSG